MKTILILLGMGLISLKGFAGSSEKIEVPSYLKEETQWLNQLNDKTNWRERQKAVKNWKTAVPLFDSQEIFFHLQLMLSDRSQRVRESTLTALNEMAEKPLYSYLRSEIIKALTKQQHPNDTENLFLKKMKMAKEIFEIMNLYAILHVDVFTGTIIGFEELEASGTDQVLESLYEMAETGLSNRKNIKIREAGIQLLNTILKRLSIGNNRRFFTTAKVKNQVFDYILNGLQIVVKGLVDENKEIQSVAKELLIKTFQKQRFSKPQVSRLIHTMAKEGFSHSNYKIRKDTIDRLLEIAKLYPSLNSEITTLIKERKTKESSHRMRVAIQKAVTQLTGKEKNNNQRKPPKHNSECLEKWQG